MAWFKKGKTEEAEPPKRSKVAEGMWLKCNHCREIVYRKEVQGLACFASIGLGLVMMVRIGLGSGWS